MLILDSGRNFYWDGVLLDLSIDKDMSVIYDFISAANDAFLGMAIYCVKAEVEDASTDNYENPRYKFYKNILNDAGIW